MLIGRNKLFAWALFFLLVIAAMIGRQRMSPKSRPVTAGALPQRGYLWQREWTPSVIDALAQADQKMDGLVVLGAEIRWNGSKPDIIRATISWDALKKAAKPCAIALRIAPFAGPFAKNDIPACAIRETAAALLSEAQSHGISVHEFQVDFDCAQKKLAGYQVWLNTLRPIVGSVPMVITSLPAWLDEPAFRSLLSEVDGFVLQVHSVPTQKESGRASLFDPGLARKWVAKAARLERPFSVALPTYWCLAGYDSAGKLLGISMDSVQPAWPGGTRVLEFGTEADAVADLVGEWRTARPIEMRELLWYRVPVATDMRNWRWPTLCAVMAGSRPVHRIEPRAQGDNLVDLAILNSGQADEMLRQSVVVTWKEGELVASDPLPGWALQVGKGRATFLPNPTRRLRLSPGEQRGIGWLRYEKKPSLSLQMVESP